MWDAIATRLNLHPGYTSAEVLDPSHSLTWFNMMGFNIFISIFLSSPWRIVDDCGGAFTMGAIGGGIFQAIKGFRNSPVVSKILWRCIDCSPASTVLPQGVWQAMKGKENKSLCREQGWLKPSTLLIHTMRICPGSRSFFIFWDKIAASPFALVSTVGPWSLVPP